MMRFVPVSLLLPFVACSPADTPDAGPAWEVHGDSNVCAALQHRDEGTVMLSISKLRNMSGINVVADSVAFAAEGRFEPDVRLSVEGRDVPVTAIGVHADGVPGLFLRFDPLPLVARHPDGFRFGIGRGAQRLVDMDLRGASATFRELRTCAEGLAATG